MVAKILPEPRTKYYRTHTREGRTSNIVTLHFSCEGNVWPNCHNIMKNVFQLYSLISPRIEKLKFSHFGTYEQSSVGLYFFDNPYERIIFQNVEAECSSHTESIRLKYLFSQTIFKYIFYAKHIKFCSVDS